ncbi:hypothetical protein IWW48_002743 [Coemansia sp. RSA 1200]|nr:hypothetical protein IWW48_002743 [Coemansia sp. RSA 1200]
MEALALCRLSTHIGLQDAPKYKDVFAIQELKRFKHDSQEALIQLTGLRHDYGADLCIESVADKLPNHDDKSKRNSFMQYVTIGTIMNASALFGRHARCCLAKRKDGRSDEDVVIKNSWSLPRDLKKSGKQGSVVPDESHNLRLITEKFSDKDVGFSYPQAISSGSVKFKDGSKYITDDTSAIYGYDDGEKEHMYRVHRRIVITPVEHFVKSVRNEAELVFVLADAMECHNAILTECGLLHRDISVNNIIIIRNEGKNFRCKPIKGLLIDFDHAISVD